MCYRVSITNGPLMSCTRAMITVEPDLIAIEIIAFPSKSSRNKNDSDLTIVIP